FSFVRPSHRTRPEQLVGLGIYLSVCVAFVFLSRLFAQPFAILYAVFLAFGMWALWRRYSLRVLKLELSVFLAQFLFQLGARFEVPLLALVSLLLLFCTTLLAALLLWKKEHTAGMLYFYPLCWVFYVASMYMMQCIKGTSC
ncbi:MAG: hypothetical protein KGQ49_01655, partial [Verrucomicrobia bacterium]|nr:hypothetical protein [Verrucomicrobiota bacterium]